MIEKGRIRKNGVRYVLENQKGDLVGILVLVDVGAQDEKKNVAGISHFLEHMIFKGPGIMNVLKFFDSIGAKFNAYTDADQTGYHIKFHKRHVTKVLERMIEIVFDFVVRGKDVKTEKGVIFEEIDMINDNPVLLALENFVTRIFGEGRLSNSISGSKKTVGRITKEDLEEYHRDFYSGGNVVVAIVGGDIEKEKGRIVRVLEKIKGGGGKKRKGGRGVKERVIVENLETDQEHVVLGFPIFGYDDERKYAMEILNVIKGGKYTSKLFTEIREKRGLVYTVRTMVKFYKNAGYFVVRTSVNKKNVREVLKIIMEVLKEEVSDEEVEEAKSHLEGVIYADKANERNVAVLYGMQVMYGEEEVLTYDEIKEKIRGVEAEEVREVGREVFDMKKMMISLVGKTKEEELRKLVN